MIIEYIDCGWLWLFLDYMCINFFLKKKLFEIIFFYRLLIVYNIIDDEMNVI